MFINSASLDYFICDWSAAIHSSITDYNISWWNKKKINKRPEWIEVGYLGNGNTLGLLFKRNPDFFCTAICMHIFKSLRLLLIRVSVKLMHI